MKFKYVHNNISSFNLEKSISFYKENLGFTELKRKTAADGSYIIVFLGNEYSENRLELTWYRDWEKPYNLGDNEIHMAFTVDDYDAAYELHKKNDCICYENTKMNLYFIADPDGFWIEILSADR